MSRMSKVRRGGGRKRRGKRVARRGSPRPRARFELTDSQWSLVSGLMPEQARGGRWKDHRLMLDGMLWVLRTGAGWRDLPERYGPWQTVYDRFRRWSQDGTFDRIIDRLQLRMTRDGLIDGDLWCVDGSNVRAHKAAAGAPKKQTQTQTWPSGDRGAGGEPSST